MTKQPFDIKPILKLVGALLAGAAAGAGGVQMSEPEPCPVCAVCTPPEAPKPVVEPVKAEVAPVPVEVAP